MQSRSEAGAGTARRIMSFQEAMPLAVIEKKPGKRQIDEEMVDRIVEETKQRKNLKEQIYDKITVPVWALDILIVVLVAALVAVMIFGRG